jgi:hypothetical protein
VGGRVPLDGADVVGVVVGDGDVVHRAAAERLVEFVGHGGRVDQQGAVAPEDVGSGLARGRARSDREGDAGAVHTRGSGAWRKSVAGRRYSVRK